MDFIFNTNHLSDDEFNLFIKLFSKVDEDKLRNEKIKINKKIAKKQSKNS